MLVSVFDSWYILIGAFLVSMALIGSMVERLPVTPAIVYLVVGFLIARYIGIGSLDPLANARMLRVMAEIAIAISLFAVGLKLRVPLSSPAWRVPMRLALPALVLTTVLCAFATLWLYHVGLGMALLMAAILSPTDPVLGGDVHVARPGDRDQLRFGVTAEGGMNDGIAMPVVLLGLGLAGHHELGDYGWRWLLVDVLWFILGGVAVGWVAGQLVGRLVLYLRSAHRLAIGLEEFLGIGVIGIAFGGAGLLQASEFLAVFASGLALRHIERSTTASDIDPTAVPVDDTEAATDPERAAAHMTQQLLSFNTLAEHIAELTMVMVVGMLLAGFTPDWRALLLAAFLFLVARPLAVMLTLAGTTSLPEQRRLIAWFGIRGIGSLYYFAYAIEKGLAAPQARQLTASVVTVIAVSIVVHGISATPLMQRYRQMRKLRGDDHA